jgi:hypothetical protein
MEKIEKQKPSPILMTSDHAGQGPFTLEMIL